MSRSSERREASEEGVKREARGVGVKRLILERNTLHASQDMGGLWQRFVC